jgi:hypothetical protein
MENFNRAKNSARESENIKYNRNIVTDVYILF